MICLLPSSLPEPVSSRIRATSQLSSHATVMVTAGPGASISSEDISVLSWVNSQFAKVAWISPARCSPPPHWQTQNNKT